MAPLDYDVPAAWDWIQRMADGERVSTPPRHVKDEDPEKELENLTMEGLTWDLWPPVRNAEKYLAAEQIYGTDWATRSFEPGWREDAKAVIEQTRNFAKLLVRSRPIASVVIPTVLAALAIGDADMKLEHSVGAKSRLAGYKAEHYARIKAKKRWETRRQPQDYQAGEAPPLRPAHHQAHSKEAQHRLVIARSNQRDKCPAFVPTGETYSVIVI